MSHQPTLQDAATDLLRTVYASRSSQGFQSANAQEFLKHAQKIINQRKGQLGKSLKQDLEKCLSKGFDANLPADKRQEHLLTAAMLLK